MRISEIITLTLLSGFFLLGQGENYSLALGITSKPSFSKEGLMVMAIEGDLWLAEFKSKDRKKVNWTQLTKGPATDQDPVWMPDGQSILFSSNSKGSFDLWLLELNGKKETERVSIFFESEQADIQPSVAFDNTVVWVHGLNADANLWIKKMNREARALTSKLGSEFNPSLSPDGKKLAYISSKGRSQQLILHYFDKKDTVLLNSGNPEFPSWAPDGQRLIYTTRGTKGGVWLTNPSGRYFNLISTKVAAASFLPDTKTLALCQLDGSPPAYNGDPDWEGHRFFDRSAFSDLNISFLPLPRLPDDGLNTVKIAPSTEEVSEKHLEHFEQLTNRLKKKYRFDTEEEWSVLNQMIAEYKERITQAGNKAQYEKIVFDFLQKKPLLRKEREGKAAVSSAHPLASEAGTEILKKGGNVVDAAIAVSFAIGVVEPDASGVGGYGEMMIYLKSMEKPTCIEFLTRVPEAASLSNKNLNPIPDIGPVKVNVPGTVAGMEMAWKKYGSNKISWADLLAPAIRLAEKGFILDEAFPTTLAKEKANYLRYPGSQSLFFNGKRPLQPGERFKNPDLAWTLRQIAEGGAKAFYEGPIAKKMLTDLKSYGNVMTAEDLSRYYAVEREPVHTTYRGNDIYSGPPPVSGGAILASRLNTLEQWPEPANYQEDVHSVHALIEATKLAPSARNKIADPGLWPVDVKAITDKARAQRIWNACFNPLSASWPDSSCTDNSTSSYWGDPDILDKKTSTGTTAFAVADAEGNMVSVTQTLGTWGGTFHVTPGLGFLYNDKLGSYSSNPKSYNARIPFARNVTSITPTLVFEGTGAEKKPWLAVGGAGNAWIGSAVFQIIAGIVDQGLSPQQAIEQPRFLVGIRRAPGPERIPIQIRVLAEDGFAPGIIDRLEAMGHDVQLISGRGEPRMGYAATVLIENGKVKAGGDPRRSGEASVVKE